MSSSRSITRRTFLWGVGGTLGVLGGASLYPGFRDYLFPPERNARAANDISTLQDAYDVCIIGSGPAGTVLGMDLVERGFKTIIIESGPDLYGNTYDDRIQGLEVYGNSGEIDYPILGSRVRALGGTSAIWTGRCSRLHPYDFERNPYTPFEASWPVTYSDLETYYSQAEKTLQVRGGEISSFHAPMSTPFPLPADLDISGLQSLMDNVGIKVNYSPTSTGTHGDGPIRVARDLLPSFEKSPHAQLISGITATKLLVDSSGRVVGAEAKNLDGVTRVIRAGVFVVASGAVESARLLLLSRSERFPEGIGNRHDRVGRCFMEHPNLTFTGYIEHNWNTLSPMYELGRSHQYYDSFKKRGLGGLILVFTQSWIFKDDLSDWDSGTLKEKIGNIFNRVRQAELRIGATFEQEPSDMNRVRLSSQLKDYFGNPAAEISLNFSDNDRRTLQETRTQVEKIYHQLGGVEINELPMGWSHHHMGTCRMGENPKTSVVDPDLRVHGTQNLYVAGSASFVTGGATHPTITIVALSHRLADHLTTRLRKESFQSRLYRYSNQM